MLPVRNPIEGSMGFLIAYDLRKPHPFTGRGHKFGEASFLCPVCAEPLFGEDGVSDEICAHVLLVFNRSGAIRCRDAAIQRLVAVALEEAREMGRDGMEVLRQQMGSNVIFFELMDQAPGSIEPEVFTFVVDLTAATPATDRGRDAH